jgi:thermitase
MLHIPPSIYAASAVTLGLLAALAPGRAAAATESTEFAAGRVIVMTRAGLPAAALERIVREHGGTKSRRIRDTDLHVVDVPAGLEREAVQRLGRHPHLKFAELDQAVRPAMTPNDPYLGAAWHIGKIGAPAAWDLSRGTGVTIAIIDTGVEASHPDLAASLVAGWNTHDNNANTAPVNGHGTWVAGTAGATMNNGIGVAAVAGSARLMPLRATDASGVGYWSSIATAITYAADHGARVANASFEKLLNSSAVMSAAQYMKSRGGLVVVAAGNSGVDEALPPNANVIAVSATDANDQFASWSSWGGYVALSAPGSPIYTTGLGGTYVQGQGTSFSSPIVAGTIALMMAANPQLANTQIEQLLYSTAVDLGAAGRDSHFGHGRVNAAAAVAAAAAATPPAADTQAPTVQIAAPLGSATVSGLVAVNVNAADNVGVTKAELRVNGTLVATDTAAPFAFSWDSSLLANGIAALTVKAYDAAGNVGTSAPVSVNVANLADIVPPVVAIVSPKPGPIKGKGSVTITTSAADDRGPAGIQQSLYIDNVLVANASGGALSYSWSMNRVASGAHTIKVVARDAAGNASSATTTVTK